jgi:hypothetical protein
LISIAYSALRFYQEEGIWNGQNILSLLPSSYLMLAIVMRYSIFNKYFSFLFKGKVSPYDPIVIYPGMFTVYWDEKNYIPHPVEYFYSFAILIFPWWNFYLF